MNEEVRKQESCLLAPNLLSLTLTALSSSCAPNLNYAKKICKGQNNKLLRDDKNPISHLLESIPRELLIICCSHLSVHFRSLLCQVPQNSPTLRRFVPAKQTQTKIEICVGVGVANKIFRTFIHSFKKTGTSWG